MLVIIPHSSEEIKLIKLQKYLISQSDETEACLVENFPLWIPLDNSDINFEPDDKNLKTFSKRIKAVTLEKPEADKNSIFSNVSILIDDKTYTSKLILLTDIKKSCEKLTVSAGFPIDFPIKLKIFRTGIAVKNPEEHSSAILNSVWCKLA